MTLIERCEANLEALMSTPGYDRDIALLWMELILSAKKGQPMNEEHTAYRDTWEIENVVGDLRAHMTDPNARQILIEEMERIERAADDLNVLVGELRDRRERQQSKLVHLSDYLQAAE